MKFMSPTAKQVLVIGSIVLGALVAEFFILEGTVGIVMPSNRHSAMSSVEIRDKGLEINFVTRNNRFSVVDFYTADGTRRQAMVIRESFFMDRQDGRGGPPNSTVSVEGMIGDNVRWTFQEPGKRGDILTDKVYRVVKESDGWSPNYYTYFSLVDGHKVRVERDVELSRTELEALDLSIAGGH